MWICDLLNYMLKKKYNLKIIIKTCFKSNSFSLRKIYKYIVEDYLKYLIFSITKITEFFGNFILSYFDYHINLKLIYKISKLFHKNYEKYIFYLNEEKYIENCILK